MCQRFPLSNLQPIEITNIDNLLQISEGNFHRHEKTRSIQMDCQSQIKEGSSWSGQLSSKGSYRLCSSYFISACEIGPALGGGRAISGVSHRFRSTSISKFRTLAYLRITCCSLMKRMIFICNCSAAPHLCTISPPSRQTYG